LRVIERYAGAPLVLRVREKWHGLLSALSGDAVACFIFGNSNGMLTLIPFWLIITDCRLALAFIAALLGSEAASWRCCASTLTLISKIKQILDARAL
jgi:hypothetical protein